jgi:hypothetical protein
MRKPFEMCDSCKERSLGQAIDYVNEKYHCTVCGELKRRNEFYCYGQVCIKCAHKKDV